MNICIFVGARPNFMKVAPLIRTIGKEGAMGDTKSLSYQLVFAGSEDDPTLEPTLFEDLQIPVVPTSGWTWYARTSTSSPDR